MYSFTVFTCVMLAVCVERVFGVTANDVVDYAKSQIGSRTWLYTSDHVTGPNTYKCNIFVADVLKEVGADAPNRWPWYSPIGAGEWANPDSSYLKGDPCWSLCTGSPVSGDVLAGGGHVGIVTGDHLTTSASAKETPSGLIVEGPWGFTPGIVCWRYKYGSLPSGQHLPSVQIGYIGKHY